MLDAVHAEYSTCPCVVRSYQLLLICCSSSLVLLLHFRPRCCKHPFPVITRGPPARFAYLGKLAHRRGAIRRHDSWLASCGNTSSYSRAVSQPVSILVRGNLGMDYEAQHHSRLLISLFVPLLPIPIHYLLQICKSLWLLLHLFCSLLVVGLVWRGRKLLGLVL